MTAPKASSEKPAAERRFDGWPRSAASMAVFRGDEVLIVERGKGASAGLWSLPGGHVEPGETTRAAALREVAEETGIAVDLVGLVDVLDIIVRRDDGSLRAHYVLSAFYGRWRAGEPRGSSDARDARFVRPEALAGYRLTEGVHRIVKEARRLVGPGSR